MKWLLFSLKTNLDCVNPRTVSATVCQSACRKICVHILHLKKCFQYRITLRGAVQNADFACDNKRKKKNAVSNNDRLCWCTLDLTFLIYFVWNCCCLKEFSKKKKKNAQTSCYASFIISGSVSMDRPKARLKHSLVLLQREDLRHGLNRCQSVELQLPAV